MSILQKIVNYGSLFTAITFIVIQVIHLTESDISLKFPSGSADHAPVARPNFSSSKGRDTASIMSDLWNNCGSTMEYCGTWRRYFNVSLETLGFHWAPAIFASVIIFGYFERLRNEWLTGKTLNYNIFLLVTVFWGNWAFAGGLGFIVGIINLILVVVGFLAFFKGSNEKVSIF